MKRRPFLSILPVVALALGLLAALPFPARGETPYLKAVREFADNVVEQGRDVYGPKHTPLFVDGLNVRTREPVRWNRKGEEWMLSNLASQQNLFRTLDGLTKIIKDPKYRRAAVEAVEYAFANLRSPNGLLYWGGHLCYNAETEKLVMEQMTHELKRHYPYYPLMWEINPAATEQFLESFWAAHILDWSNLDMNRHGKEFDKPFENVWDKEYKGGEVFFAGKGLTFCNTGSDLIYAGVWLNKFSGREEPMTWAKRMGSRYIETRNPKTGLGGYQYSRRVSGDRAQQQFGPEFGPNALESTLLQYDRAIRRYPIMGICEMMLGEMLGEKGRDFSRWALEDLEAYGKHAYNPETNSFKALFTDGREVGPEDVKRDGYFGGPENFEPKKAVPVFFRAYAMAFRLSGDRPHWDMARHIARGFGLGDIGATPAKKPSLNLNAKHSDPRTLLAFLELHRKTGKAPFLKMAKRIGDNILDERFQKGLFVKSPKHLNAKFDAVEPLVLLHLDAALNGGGSGSPPKVWPGEPYFHCPYDGIGRTYDNEAIYGQTTP